MKKIVFLNSISSVVWGVPMLCLFTLTSLRLSFKSQFCQIFKFPKILKSTLGETFKSTDTNGISEFSAFCSVLGACLGTGNIVGVATAIYSGGPGTVFWMWISAFLSMTTAYSENYLGSIYSVKTKNNDISQGAFAYIGKGLKMESLARLYAFFSLCSALCMGNMTQSNSLAVSLREGFGLPVKPVGIIISLICTAIIFGGIKRIARFQTFAVPAMTSFYLALSVIILIKHRQNILPCISVIFKDAFTAKAASGFGMYSSMRYGISRGVFSNEAGLGSSTIIHAESCDTSAETRGMWAMLEVFTDTVFMCTVTALVILTSTGTEYLSSFGASLSYKAYSTIGILGQKGISVLTSTFALTSLIGCSFYGEKSFQYLFGKKHLKLYKIIYALLIIAGASNPPKAIWLLADIFNGLMAIPNLFAVNCLAKKIEFI